MNKKISRFLKRLQEKDLTIALAESMTCGLAAHQLSTAPGTSSILMGSIVCYSPEAKCSLLKVPSKLIEKHTAESMEVTKALVQKLPRLLKADIYAAITGLASAGGTETSAKPVGTVFFCVKYRKQLFKLRKVYRGTPLQIRQKACLGLYALITKKILS